MKFKRFLICLFAFLMVFSLAACKTGGEQGHEGDQQGQGNKEEYKITFESNGGSEVAEIKAEKGAAITKPADPTKENMTFGGWYSDIDLLEAYEFPSVMPSQNVELFAKWVVTLSFDSQGGPSYEPIVGEGGKTYKMPEDPTRDGYVFVGWYTDQAYTNKLTYVMPRTNTTAYAKWQVYETGSAITVPLKMGDNDGVFQLAEEEDGVKITATAAKGEWAYCAAVIPVATKHNNTVVVELIGTKDATAVLKVEGGDATAAIETSVTFTGEVQKVIFTGTEDNFSTVSGSKFLVFLNGGTPGCGETPEYVKIKSVKLFRTVDASATQKAAIFFAANGGDDIAELYDVPGTAVSAPADPERAGWVFAGWYADSALTTPYTFTTMPAEGAVVFAKWEKAKQLKEDIIILGGELAKADDSHVTATYNEQTHMLTVSKSAEAGQWEWVGIKFAEGVDASGYDHLRVSFVGPKGKQILFKVNDKGELFVTATGEMQSLDLEFDVKMDMSKFAVVIFPGTDAEGASGEFTIAALQFGNYPALHNALASATGWSTPVNDAGEANTKTTFTLENGVLKFQKAAFEGTDYEWDHVKYVTDANLVGFNALSMVVKGTAGERLLVKIYDKIEKWVDLTGENQYLYFEYEADYDAKKPALVLFANPGANGTGHEVEVSQIFFVQNYTAPVEEVKEDKDLLTGAITAPAGIEASRRVIIAKNGGGEWEWVGLTVEGADINDYTKLVAKIQGPSGEKFLFKVNDQLEKWVTCDGTLQDVEFVFPENTVWAADKQNIILFANGGESGTGHEFVISKLELQNDEASVDLLAGKMAKEPSCTFERQIVLVKATTNTEEWDCIKIDLGADLTGYAGVKYTVKGTEGEKVLLKANDQNAGEEWITLGAEPSTGVIDLANLTFDKSKSTMIVFPNVQGAGTGHEIIISEFVYAASLSDQPQEEVKHDVDLLANPTTTANGHEYEWQLRIAKTGGGEWDWVGLTVSDVELAGYTKVVATVKGTAGETLLLKTNDKGAGEHSVALTGEVQEVEFDLPANFEWTAAAKTMIMFANPGVSGTGHQIVITKLELQGEGKDALNLLNGKIEKTDPCSAEKALVLTKPTTNTNTWDSFWIEVSQSVEGYKGFKYTVKGTEGERILFKAGDQHETFVTFTGEVQSAVVDLSDKAIDPAKKAMILFVNPDSVGTGHPVEITELVFLVELPEE